MQTEEIKAWAIDSLENHLLAVIQMLLGTHTERETAFMIFEKAGRPFDIRNLAEYFINETPVIRAALSTHYKANWQKYDCDIRFGEGHTKQFADFIKMVTYGMTREEIEEETKRRSPWIPLEQKRKGHY